MKMSLTHLFGLACLVAMVVTCTASALVSDDASQDNNQNVKNEGTGIVKRDTGSNVAFSAYLVGEPSMSDSVLIFNTEISDVGNNYSPTTGVFTAPEDGMYQFYFTIAHWELIGTPQTATLYVGADIMATCIIQPDGKIIQSSALVNLQLASGDEVSVKVNTGKVYGSNTKRVTSFAGIRLCSSCL